MEDTYSYHEEETVQEDDTEDGGYMFLQNVDGCVITTKTHQIFMCNLHSKCGDLSFLWLSKDYEPYGNWGALRSACLTNYAASLPNNFIIILSGKDFYYNNNTFINNMYLCIST